MRHQLAPYLSIAALTLGYAGSWIDRRRHPKSEEWWSGWPP
jgi:hypothetical protein